MTEFAVDLLAEMIQNLPACCWYRHRQRRRVTAMRRQLTGI